MKDLQLIDQNPIITFDHHKTKQNHLHRIMPLKHSHFNIHLYKSPNTTRFNSFTMESSSTTTHNKTLKTFYFFHIMLRLIVIGTSLAAAVIIFTSKQSIYIFGTFIDAKYSYSSAYKFFGFANVIASVFSILSLVYILLMCRHGSNPSIFFLLFVHDLVMCNLVLAGCAAATAVGYIGKYGNMHIGWMAICDRFEKFCDQVMTSIMLSYVSVLALFVCTVGSASRSRDV